MDILIVKEIRSETMIHVELACGKKAAYLGFNFKHGFIDVCVQNASHRVWRGMGRTFRSFAEAIDAYKSPEVKAMIRHLEDMARPKLVVIDA